MCTYVVHLNAINIINLFVLFTVEYATFLQFFFVPVGGSDFAFDLVSPVLGYVIMAFRFLAF